MVVGANRLVHRLSAAPGAGTMAAGGLRGRGEAASPTGWGSAARRTPIPPGLAQQNQ